MGPFAELIGSMKALDGRYVAAITERWMQGRTTYGGASAALCLEAVHRFVGDAPPLRSAQLTFTGPAGNESDIEVTSVRKGKAMQFLRADLTSQGKVATTALFAFGTPRLSAFDKLFVNNADVPSPEECSNYFEGGDKEPSFAVNFDSRLVSVSPLATARLFTTSRPHSTTLILQPGNWWPACECVYGE